MNDTARMEAIRSELADMPTEELRRSFKSGLVLVRDNLLRLAAILQELEQRGEVIEGDSVLLGMLRKIAKGELLVDAVVKFASKPCTLRAVARMSLEEQAEALQDVEGTHKKVAKKKGGAGFVVSPSNRKSLEEIAKAGTVKDVAAMCLELVRRCANPTLAAELLIPRLEAMRRKEAS